MTIKYTPGHSANHAIDPTKCPASIPYNRGWSTRRCSRPRGPGPDGWCQQHDPVVRKARADEGNRAYAEKMARDRANAIKTALREASLEQLEQELKRRRR